MQENLNIKRILISPLDWGLGHATRCIPIIKTLIQHGYEVIVAAEGSAQHLLQLEFPSITILPIRGYRISYASSKRWLPLKIVQQIPKIISTIQYEHRWLQQAVAKHHIDLVISDNRYGLYTTVCPCIFITHQLTIKAPNRWLEKMMQFISYRYINKFTACWVPDIANDRNVAGILSHPQQMPAIPVHYIGLLSRFSINTSLEKKYAVCILLSGPEPQRSILEEKILQGLSQIKEKVILVRGKPGSNEQLPTIANVTIYNHLAEKELALAIQSSEYIISRSGYTTVMELLMLQKKSILIPTPGQTEQEYLAQQLMQQQWCYSISQDAFDITKALEQAAQFRYAFPDFPSSSTTTIIPQLVEALLLLVCYFAGNEDQQCKSSYCGTVG